MNRPTIMGSVYSASSDGFARMLAEANRVSHDGYELITVVQLGKSIAPVFKKRQQREEEPHGGFFE